MVDDLPFVVAVLVDESVTRRNNLFFAPGDHFKVIDTGIGQLVAALLDVSLFNDAVGFFLQKVIEVIFYLSR